MEHFGKKDHFRWFVGEVDRKLECCLIYPSFEGGPFWALEAEPPLEEVIVYESYRYRHTRLAFLDHYNEGSRTLKLLSYVDHSDLALLGGVHHRCLKRNLLYLLI